jgi:hypothetical protein
MCTAAGTLIPVCESEFSLAALRDRSDGEQSEKENWP